MPTSATASGGVRPGILSFKNLALPTDSEFQTARKAHPRRRIRSHAFPNAASGARSRKERASSRGKRSGPATPLHRWQFNEKPPPQTGNKVEEVGVSEAPPPPRVPRVSARKLAAGIWRLRPQEVSVGEECRRAPIGLEGKDVHCFLFPQGAQVVGNQFLKRLSEEKASWRSREHEKIRAIIEAMKGDLDRERKKRQRLEIIQNKLVNELSEAKLTAKQLLQDYEKEHKARELVEEVCDELAKEIGEDKAEIEALKVEALNIREQVEEEKKMLQMAQVWREERVQMKLIDAKLTLEDKYSQLRELNSELEAFLAARTSVDLDVASMRGAELLKEKANSVNIEGIKEFSYQPPPASEDIYAVFEQLRPRQDNNEREFQPCCGHSPRSHASKINTASPETDVFLERPRKQYTHDLQDSNDDADDDSDWETVSHAEEHGSSNTLDGSEPSVNGYSKESNASMSEGDRKGSGEIKHNEIIEVSSTYAKSRKKVSSIRRLWRSSTHYNDEDLKKTSVEMKPGRLSDGRISNGTLASNNCKEYKKHSVEPVNGRLSNGGTSNGTLSPDIGSAEVGLNPGSLGHWSSPDSLNPHIARGMKGCIEWPRGNHKYSLKAKLIEARTDSQKIQLRHVLEQKF